jgi:CAAX protease family protein
MHEPAENGSSEAHNAPPIEPARSPAEPELKLQTEHYRRAPFAGGARLSAILRTLAYFGLREVVYLLLGTVIFYALRSGMLRLWALLIAEAVFLTAAVIPALILSPLESRPFGDYGLPWRHAFGKLFWTGAVWGFAAITLLLLVLHLMGGFDFGRPVLHGARILKFAAFWGLFFLTVGFAEEFYVRGYAQFTLTQGIGFWPAAIVFSVAFGALHYHNPGETTVGLIGAGCIGLFFCLTLRRTGNLWFAVGFHATWDWGESYFYSVPDSGTIATGHLMNSSLHGPAWLTGGSVGPEGSVFAFVTIALLWIAFDRVYREVRYAPSKKLAAGSAG